MARTKKSGSRKAAARNPSAKRAAPKKAAKKAGRAPARKSAAKKAPARKTGKKATKTSTTKAAAKKASGRKATSGTKKATKKSGAKRAPNPAFMKAMTPDPDLAAVVGNQPQPRTEITKRVWAYIKKNNLQDAKERRMINADDKLKKVFGGKGKVSMFEMTKHVNNHLS
jgi:upstream activation factor subunit UAF30